jgi:hypothetical protein
MIIRLLTSALFLSLPVIGQAATITAAGIDTLTPPANGAGDVADLDANGSGGDGFVVFNSLLPGGNSNQEGWDQNIILNLPAYVSNLDGTGSTSSGGWANYDSATVDGIAYPTGGINLASGNGVETALFTFQLSGSVPPSITVGFLTDNTDNVAWSSSMIRLEGPDGLSEQQSPTLDGGSDLVKFNIEDGAAGDTFTVHATSAGNGSMIALATFDSIPEPSSLSLLVLGSLAALGRKRA